MRVKSCRVSVGHHEAEAIPGQASHNILSSVLKLNPRPIQSSVVSNLISAAFGWQYFEHDNVRATCPRIVKAAWFSALMMSVSSIAAASQQLVALHRLSTYPNSHAVIRRLLMGAADCSSVVGASSPASTDTAHVRISVKTKSNKHKKQMSLRQAFLWQVPVSLLDGSLYFFIGGLSIIVYFDFSETVKGSSFWSAVRHFSTHARRSRDWTNFLIAFIWLAQLTHRSL